jgi:hypothetical protein
MCTMTRYLMLLVGAGLLIGAALGLAGAASAATTDAQQHNTVAAPVVKAHPAPEAQPGWHWHHGMHHLADLQPGYTR